MRDYSKVSPRFWTGETGRLIRKLGPETQVVAFYLFTCPSANMLGLYYLAMPTLVHETGRAFKGASEALRSLREAKFAYYDSVSEHIWVPNMAREQIGARLSPKDNRHVAVLRELEQLRKTPFFNDFVNRYRDVYHLHGIELNAENGSHPGSPFEGPSEPLRSQAHEQEQEQKGKSAASPPPSKVLTGAAETNGDPPPAPPSRARLPKRRLPEDFLLSDAMRTQALSRFPDCDPAEMFTQFRAHHESHGKAMASWTAAWTTWIGNGEKFGYPKSSQGGSARGMERLNFG